MRINTINKQEMEYLRKLHEFCIKEWFDKKLIECDGAFLDPNYDMMVYNPQDPIFIKMEETDWKMSSSFRNISDTNLVIANWYIYINYIKEKCLNLPL